MTKEDVYAWFKNDVFVFAVYMLLCVGMVVSILDGIIYQVKWHSIWSVVLAILMLCVLVPFSKFFIAITERNQKLREVLLIFAGFAVPVVVSLIANYVLGQKMISDFEAAARCLMAGQLHVEHDWQFEYWSNYEVILSALGWLVSPSLITGQLLNAVCIALMVYPIYQFAKDVTSEFSAMAVSMLFIFYPSVLLYGTILTGEFLNATALLYAFHFLRKTMAKDVWNIKYLFLGSLCLAIAQLFKPLSPIILIAYLFCVFNGILMSCISLKNISKGIGKILTVAIIFTLFSKLLATIFYSAVPHQGVDQRRHGFPWKQLAIGLCVESDGQWAPEISKVYEMEPEDVKIQVISSMQRDWRQYPKLCLKKFIRLHQSDNWAKGWFAGTTGLSVSGKCAYIVDVGFVAVCLMFLLGVMQLIITRSTECFMPVLIIIGFSCLLSVFEFQGRYRVSIYPFYFCIMAYGIAYLEKLIKGKNHVHS